MAAEFKIARLRFNWLGAWATGTPYNRDAVVEHDGKMYVCLVPHTSGDFNTDLTYVTNTGASTPYWTLIIDGTKWIGAWQPNTPYNLGNIVTYGGRILVCTVAHQSGSQTLTSNNWNVYAETAAWHSAWNTNTVYGVGDIVKYGGKVYRCTVNHVSASTSLLGLEADSSSWETFNFDLGIEYKGDWVPSTRYKYNDLVKLGPDLYICTTYNSDVDFIESNWALWLPGFEFTGAWSNQLIYDLGDVTKYGGYSYYSKTENNYQNIPSVDSTNWGLLTQGYDHKLEWNNSTTYLIGNLVTRGGRLYEATADNSSVDPAAGSVIVTYTASGSSGTTLKVSSTTNILKGMIIIGAGFTRRQTVTDIVDNVTLLINEGPDGAVNNGQSLTFVGVSANWTLLSPGVRWQNRWTAGTSYLMGDLVVWKNTTYICSQNHIAVAGIGGTGNRPDTDTTNTYWTIYVLHARKNALNTNGDIEYYNNRQYDVIPIGTTDYTLQTNGSTLAWNHINSVPAVYYVAPSGTDTTSDGWGLTWDKPWKTISYATSIVGAGRANVNAASLITKNKEWMIAEMLAFITYETAQAIPPFTTNPLNLTKTARDARLVIDAIAYDLARGGNSQTVATALSYFKSENTNAFINSTVTSQIAYFIACLNQLNNSLNFAVTQTDATTSYQTLNGVLSPVLQNKTGSSAESGAATSAQTLMSLIISALSTQSTLALPSPNSGLTATIMVKTGTYSETLPITIPENVALNGDELRGTVVQPKLIINQVILSSSAISNLFAVNSTTGMVDGTPVQFTTRVVSGVTETMGGVTAGQTYYVIGTSITPTQFAVTTSITDTFTGDIIGGSNQIINVPPGQISYLISRPGTGAAIFGNAIPAGTTITYIDAVSNIVTMSAPALANNINVTFNFAVTLTTNVTVSYTRSYVYGGDAIKNMFYLRNGSGLRNMTLTGLLGTLGAANSFSTQRPTGGAYTSLDPGTGTNDTTAWIFTRSPYVQNVTTFGQGCVGLKIDGTLHAGGNKSIVCNDFTQILSDGIGIWCTGSGSLTEAVSVFSYYGYAGYFAEDGGRIRATNGNSSYGTYGVIAEGYDATESPITGNVFNQSLQVQATVESAFGSQAQLLKLNFSNSGSGYYSTTENLLSYSNYLLGAGWSTSNLTLNQNTTAPTGQVEGWGLTATAAAGSSSISQTITINPAGATYTGVSAVNINGNGIGATFTVIVTATAYIVTVDNGGGSQYVNGAQMFISGAQLGGLANVNNCNLTVTRVSGQSVLEVVATGTVPAGSAQGYTLSTYVKKGTASEIAIGATFSGATYTSGGTVNYNFSTGALTLGTTGTYASNALPTQYGVVTLTNGWYRLWVSVSDAYALNNQLTFNIWPNGVLAGSSGTYSYVYGNQVQVSPSTYSPTFYLETATTQYASHANYQVVGAGTGVVTVGDETRSYSVFQTRVTDPGNGAGGTGYLTASNAAQAGTSSYIQLAQSDTNLESNYVGMRVFINSGTGAGNYGYISSYDTNFKIAQVLKESFDILNVTNTTASTNLLTLDSSYNTSTLYINQAIQFIPTYNSLTVSSVSLSQQTVVQVTGGTVNTVTVPSTSQMTKNMKVIFTGVTQGGITVGYTYYIADILDPITITLAAQSFGPSVQLINSAPSGSLVITYTANTSYVSGPTTGMSVNLPIQFTGSSIGGISIGTGYYINDIIDSNNFTISTTKQTVTVTASSSSTNGFTGSTSTLVPLNPIVFSGTVFGNVVEGTKYYIGKIIDANTFSIASSLTYLTITATQSVTNLITTTGDATLLVANNPIVFVGTTFGNIQAETVYYVQVVNSSTTFTISQTPSGAAVNLTTATGNVTAKSAPTAFTLATVPTGSMTGTSTYAKTALTFGQGALSATFSTELFGGVSKGNTYYVKTIDSVNKQITITATSNGASAVTLSTKTGSMNIAAVGWDHVNPGTPFPSSLDSSSFYFIEPRVTYTDPSFSQQSTTLNTLVGGSAWSNIAYGNGTWMAFPNGNAIAATSTDGITWSSIALPGSSTWTGIAYGNGYWVGISSGGITNSTAIYSNSSGLGWRSSNLPSATTWSNIVYGNGRFVTIASGTSSAAYSSNYGKTWASATGLSSATWSGLTYGRGRFVAVASGSRDVAYSTNGSSWIVTSNALSTSTTWSGVAFGNGRFVAVSSTSASPSYSFDGITWYDSPYAIVASEISYGQGIFVAISVASGTAYTSEDGIRWIVRTISNSGYNAIQFGFDSSNVGKFITVTGTNVGSIIYAGARTKARPIVTSGIITSISEFEPGSGYSPTPPTVTFTDPNTITQAVVTARIGKGSLASPTFINNGSGYSTTSTAVTITGDGYSDAYQTGLTLIVKNLTKLPSPGDNLTIAGNSKIYKVTSAVAVYGTTAPNIQANIQIAPDMSVALSPANNAAVTIRQKYSQVRLTGHDFLNIGYGNAIQANYPGQPTDTILKTQNQTVEVNFGRVFYTTTDQDGNFKVGGLFGVEQATGIVTLSATQFGLTGLSTISLGGIAVGGSSVVVTQFSTDQTFVANSDSIIPTQRAIKAYLTGRLSQGGANTFTGLLTAGTVVVGGPNKMYSSIPLGTSGSNIKMASKVNFTGQVAGVDGDVVSYNFFIKSGSRRTP